MLRFYLPLIEPVGRISRSRLSDKDSSFRPRTGSRAKPLQPQLLVQVVVRESCRPVSLHPPPFVWHSTRAASDAPLADVSHHTPGCLVPGSISFPSQPQSGLAARLSTLLTAIACVLRRPRLPRRRCGGPSSPTVSCP